MIADHHMHSGFCPHAEGAPGEYVERAAELGMREVGFAEHLPFPRGWRVRHDVTDDWAMGWDDVEAYVTAVRDLADEYAPDVRVVLGIEADYLDDALDDVAEALRTYQFDFVIGSVHVVGDRFGFDHPELREQVPAYGIDRVHLETLELAARAARSGLFDVIGHLDHARKFGLPQDAVAVRAAADEALGAIAAAGVAVELNTAGWRKGAGGPFPEPALLARAHELGIPLVFASDAHSPRDVGADFARAVAVARAAGYERTLLFGGGLTEALA